MVTRNSEKQKEFPVRRTNDLTDEQDYWMNVREMAKRIEGWREDGYEDEYEALHQEVDDHLIYYWRQRQAIRWTDNIDALEEEDSRRWDSREVSSNLFFIAYFAVMADVRRVMEANAA